MGHVAGCIIMQNEFDFLFSFTLSLYLSKQCTIFLKLFCVSQSWRNSCIKFVYMKEKKDYNNRKINMQTTLITILFLLCPPLKIATICYFIHKERKHKNSLSLFKYMYKTPSTFFLLKNIYFFNVESNRH